MEMKGYPERKIILLLFLLSFGCNRSAEIVEFESFPCEIEYQSRVIEIPPILFFPFELLMLEDILVAVDIKADYFFHVFLLPDIKYSGSFIRRGNGPEEEVFINPKVRKISGNKFFYQTLNYSKDVTFDAQTASLKETNSTFIENNLFGFQHMFKINSLYYGWQSSDTINREFLGYNQLNEKVFEFGPLHPDFGRRLGNNNKKRLADKNITVKPDQSRFAAVYLFFPTLRIFDSNDGQVLKELYYENGQSFPEAAIADNSTKQQQDMIMKNYRSVKSTDNYIYALYVGKINKDLLYQYDNAEELGDHSNEIHVFDWDGNPVKKILLDRNIFSFEVSTDDMFLIASSITTMDSFFLYSFEHEK